MNRNIQIILLFMMTLLSSLTWSVPSIDKPSYSFQYLKQGHLFFEIGGFNATQGKSQNIGIDGLIGDHFTVSQHNDQNILLGLGYFLDGLQKDRYHLLYGLNAFYLSQTAVEGNVIQEQLFTNLSYRYFITHFPIYFSTKAYFNMNNDHYNLMLDLGLGPNIMNINKFQEYEIAALPDQAFSSHATVTFSATVGFGIKFNNVWKNIPLEIAYRFFYLGQGSLNKNNNQLTDSLTTGNNYANALTISINS